MSRCGRALVALLLFLCGGCTGRPVYEGMLSPVTVDGVQTARLDRLDGSCLGVSLPAVALNKLQAGGPRQVAVTGGQFGVPQDEEIAWINVNGRRIGYRQCGFRYIFVALDRDVAWGGD